TRITRDLQFRELRILGRDVPLPDAHVLVLTPILPWPIDRGSQRRMDAILRALSEQNKLVSLCALNTESTRPHSEILRELRDRYPALYRLEVYQHAGVRGAWGRLGRLLLLAADVGTGAIHRIAGLDTCPPGYRRAV